MTTQQLLALDLLAVVLGTVLFLVAGVITVSAPPGTSGRRVMPALVCTVLGLLTVVGRLGPVFALADAGWWFAADKALLAVPIALVAVIPALLLAVPFQVATIRGHATARGAARAGAALLIAGFGSAAGVLVAFVVGYPISVTGAAAIILLVAGVSGVTWLAVTGRRRPAAMAGLIAVALTPMLIAASVAFYRDIQPVVIGATGGGHQHLAAGATNSSPDVAELGAVSVADLRTGPELDRPVRSFTLRARQQSVLLDSGTRVDGWTFGSLPGPEIRVRQGDLVEVRLENTDIADGVTLHWHGYPVPNGEDGVAGVTQDAVAPGETFTYRFVADDTGTYWYHAHQVSSESVGRGLFGVLIVEPAVPPTAPVTDVVLPVHTINGVTMIGATDTIDHRTVPAGTGVRVRLINTDAVPQRISLTGATFTVVAVDGTELNGPTPISEKVLRIPAGGRDDATVTMPDRPVAVGVEGATGGGLLLAPTGAGESTAQGEMFRDGIDLDLLGYGSPVDVPGMTDAPVNREATLVLDRQLRFLGGVPTFAQTVNGQVHPHVPPIVVASGDLLRLTVVNRSADTHPMHPHGHRVLVESRNGVPVAGSPLWLDTFDVQPGEVWQVLLRADNPGIWMAHCHNLEHATQGMVVHLIYDGVQSPFRLGGDPGNRPE